MSSPSEAPNLFEDPEVLAPDQFVVTIPKDGSVRYDFQTQEAVERFFGTRVLTTPEALREVVRKVRAEQQEASTSAQSARSQRHDAEEAGSTNEAQRESLPDDAIINQRSILVHKLTYLRLARQGAFPNRKIGKLVFARWGDVRRAFLDEKCSRQTRQTCARPSSGDDGLDDIRRQLGFAPKGK